MEHHICACCGGELQKQGQIYVCPYCRATFEDDYEVRAAKKLSTLLDEARLEKLSNARRLLFEAAHVANPSDATVLEAARKVRQIFPDDDYAILYQLSIEGDHEALNNFLLRKNLDLPLAKECYRWILAGLEARNAASLKSMCLRYFTGKELFSMLTAIEEEDAKLSEGIYEPSIPRDVFLAYSSADQIEATRVLNLLEANGFLVFAAFRNMRHGKGAADNYLSHLQVAMKHCKVLVYLSSSASRSLSCDALKVELPYINDNLPAMKRIEYIVEPYSAHTPVAVKILLKQVFAGLEWCQSDEDLIKRLLEYTTAKETIVCPSCGETLPKGTRFCPKCGHAFVKKPNPEPQPQPQPRQAATNENPESAGAIMRGLGSALAGLGRRAATYVGKKIEGIGQGDGSAPAPQPKPKPNPQPASRRPDRAPGGSDARAFYANSLAGADSSDIPVIPGNPFDVRHFVRLRPNELALSGGGSVLTGLRRNRQEYIVIPDGIEVIGERAFASCRYLKAVILPETVTHIEMEAFLNCSSLQYVYLPNSLTFVAAFAFNGCASLTKVHFGPNVGTIGSNPFLHCPSLERVTIDPDNTYYALDNPEDNVIYDRANKTIVSVNMNSAFPSGVETIGSYAFSTLDCIDAVTLPDEVRVISPYAFADCPNLKRIGLPPKLQVVGAFAFSGSVKLESLDFGHGLEQVGDNAFAHLTCPVAFPFKKPLFGLPEGFSSSAFAGYKGKAKWAK